MTSAAERAPQFAGDDADVPTGPDDLDLVRRARGGDLPAFEVLVRRHTGRLYRIAVRIVGSREDAEDCVQNSWLAAWRALPGYRAEAAPTTWLYRIATNEALMTVRRRRPVGSLEDAAEAPDPAASTVPDRVVSDLAVRRALAALPPHYRAVIVLREFEALSYDEIAAVLATTVGTVRNRLRRARLELVDLLEDWR
jgi:RNA polymerase sigma-70 factor, ECF subfamily